ncbi:MAG: hypothetical protein V4663_03300 [Bacteroidota bacterium]
MKDLKTRKFWFLVLSVGICISFSSFTVFNQFAASPKIYAESFSEKGTESDEKSSESNHPFYIQEVAFELPLALNDASVKTLGETEFWLLKFWPSPNTPPPDLG